MREKSDSRRDLEVRADLLGNATVLWAEGSGPGRAVTTARFTPDSLWASELDLE